MFSFFVDLDVAIVELFTLTKFFVWWFSIIGGYFFYLYKFIAHVII